VEPELQAVSDPAEFSLSTANIQEDVWLDIAMNDFGMDRLNAILWIFKCSILICSIKCKLHLLLTGAIKNLMINI